MCQIMSNRGLWRVETRIADMVGDGDVIMISVWSKARGFETAQFISSGRSDQVAGAFKTYLPFHIIATSHCEQTHKQTIVGTIPLAY